MIQAGNRHALNRNPEISSRPDVARGISADQSMAARSSFFHSTHAPQRPSLSTSSGPPSPMSLSKRSAYSNSPG